MDPLSDVLRAIRLTGAHFFASATSGPWGLEAPPARELSPRVLPGAQHLISYHVVMHGRCWGGLRGESLLALEAGDVILFPHGDAHVMCSSPEPGPLPRVGDVPRFPAQRVLGDPEHPDVRLVCGFFGCDPDPFNPLCQSLPRVLRVRGMSEGLVGMFARQVLEETEAGRVGAESLLTRLAELMFIEVLRRQVDAMPDGGAGWLSAMRVPFVARVLHLLHGQPAHPWTIAELATEAATSRTVLAERFTRLVGVPPMQYLTQWRMQLASVRLRESGAKLAAIAAEVGYESETSFNRAFKKATGVSPGQWRQGRVA